MNKVAFSLWFGLVIYTLIYILWIQSTSILLLEIINGEANPFASQFFNLMGLVPCYFLMDYLYFQNHSKTGIIFFLFGFLGGAFSILLGYHAPHSIRRPMPWWVQGLLLLLILLTTTLIIQGFWQGDPSLYFRHFFQDSLIGIMTVDFLVLYVWSIYRAKQLFDHWKLAFVPIIGFGILMLLDQRHH